MSDKPTPYRPSNGSEGSAFEAKFCGTCAKWDSTVEPEGFERGCDIQLAAAFFGASEENYPEEWVQGGGAGPRCTAYAQRDGYALASTPNPVPRCPLTVDLFGSDS